MRLRDPLTDCKSESETPSFRHAGPHAIGAPETLEDVRNISRGYSDPRIAHCKRHIVRMHTQAEIDFAAGRRVLDRVRDEVEKQLTKPSGIAHDLCFCGELQIHRDACAFP